MLDKLARSTGRALFWKGAELVGVKLIFVVRLLVVARLLSPDDFGLLAIGVTTIGFLLSLTNFGMMPALVQHAAAERRHYDAAWTVTLLRSLALALGVIVAAPLVARIYGEPRAVEIVRVLALGAVLEAAASIRVADLTRQLQFRSLALIGLSKALVNTALTIGLATRLGVWALVIGAVSGSAALMLTSYIMAPYRPRWCLESGAVSRLVRFGRWVFLTSLFVVAGRMLLQVILARRLGTAELGVFFLATRLAFLPSEVSTGVVGSVVFPLFARLKDSLDQATRAFRAILSGMATALIPVCALMLALAPSLVTHVLGAKWEGTVPVIQVLVLVNVVGLLGAVAVPLFEGLGLPQRVTLLEVVQSTVVVALAWFLAGPLGVVGAAVAWLGAVVASQGLSGFFAGRLLPSPLAGLAPPLTMVVLVSAVGGVAAWIVDLMLPGLFGLLAGAAVGSVVCGLLLWVLDRRLDLGLARDLARAFPQLAPILEFGGGRPS